MSEEGFLRRWARRKTETREGRTPEPDPAPVSAHVAAPAPAGAPGPAPFMPAQPAPGGHAAHPLAQAPAGRAAPSSAGAPSDSAPDAAPGAGIRLPTMDDVARLTPESDYSAFVARGVDAAVRRSALKKLFSDPHFNAIDRLDVYMDDYNQASPLAEGMLESLQHSKSFFARAAEDAQARLAREAAAQRAGDAAAGIRAGAVPAAGAADPHPAGPATPATSAAPSEGAPTVRPETPALPDNGIGNDTGAGIDDGKDAGIRVPTRQTPAPDHAAPQSQQSQHT